jgi:hypothetical protein
MLNVVVLLSVLCTDPPSGAGRPPIDSGVGAVARYLWQSLPGSQAASGCADYDYFPEGGMRNFYCHLLGLVSPEQFEQLVGVPVFSGGPHHGATLDLENRRSFGRYNPAFVRWLRQSLVPALTSSAVRALGRGAYARAVAPLARIEYVTYQKLLHNPRCLEAERAKYEHALASGPIPDGYMERYYDFMDDGFCGSPEGDFERRSDDGWDGNVVKTAVGFWLRRWMDGTQKEFAAALTDFLSAYDPGFLERPALHNSRPHP